MLTTNDTDTSPTLDEAIAAEFERMDLGDRVAAEMQMHLEAQMKDAGMQAYLANLERAHGQTETATGYGQRLLQTTIRNTAAAIVEARKVLERGGSGRRPDAVITTRDMDPQVLAYLTAKGVVDGASVDHPLTRVASRVGTMVEDEMRLDKFAQANPGAFKWTMQRIEQVGKNARQHRAGITRHIMSDQGIEWAAWTTARKISVGVWLIDIFCRTTGLFRLESVMAKAGRGVKTTYRIVPEPGTLQWIEQASEYGTLLATEHWPTIIPPKPWTSPFGGGYHTSLIPEMPLVKTRGHAGAKQYLEELESLDLSRVYAAVNRVQDTAWRVNQPVLAVMAEVVERAIEVRRMPPGTDLEMPPKPDDIDTNATAKKWWKKAASKVHAANARNRSRRIQVRRCLDMARRFAKYPEFFFPHQMDFRGRLYAVPAFLTPQGADWAKGLLTFASGKPIETQEQAEWLAIHVANTFGADKIPFAERWNWTVDRTAQIERVAADPLASESLAFWAHADSPWQFLAACFEWAGFMAQGWGFVSSLPVALDGTCNGLQHYSAALRDPVGGAAVNLLPAEAPADIYGEVARRLLPVVDKAAREASGEDGRFARGWAEFGIDRSLCKRPVMTLPYGCTQYSVRSFVEDVVRERISEGAANPWAYTVKETGARRDDIFGATRWLQPRMWAAIGATVAPARAAMAWLQEIASAVAGEGLPVCWTTEDGFVVQQAYVATETSLVKTKLDGKIEIRLEYAYDTHKMDTRRQRTGIAPNWVHSRDATALRMFVNLAHDDGLRSFCLVHDSYGVCAADVPSATRHLREAFVGIYRGRHVLAEFADEVCGVLSDERRAKLPEAPPMGSLDIEAVMDSRYFFA